MTGAMPTAQYLLSAILALLPSPHLQESLEALLLLLLQGLQHGLVQVAVGKPDQGLVGRRGLGKEILGPGLGGVVGDTLFTPMTVVDHLTLPQLQQRIKKALAAYHAKQGLTAQEVAAIALHTSRWVCATVARYNREGLEALPDRRHDNRQS